MRTTALAIVLTLLSAASITHAQDPAEATPAATEARALFDRGRELARQRRFSEAAEAFGRSVELVDRPSSRFNLAVCLYAQNRYVEATVQLERYLQTAEREQEGASWDDALQMVTHARRSVSELVIEVVPADATVTIDGDAVPGEARRTRTLNPGPHVVRVDADGHRAQLTTVETSPGETLIRTFSLESTRVRPRLSVRAEGAEAPIRVDGQAVGRGEASLRLDVGPHVVETGPEGAGVRREIELDWNVHTQLELGVGPSSAPSDSSASDDNTWLWVSLGSGAAAIALGVILGVVVASQPSVDGAGTIVLNPAAARPTLSAP